MIKQGVLCLFLFLIGSCAGFFSASSPSVSEYLSHEANLTTVVEQGRELPPPQSYASESSDGNTPRPVYEAQFVKISPDLANMFLPRRKSFQSNLDAGVARALSLTAEEEQALNSDLEHLYTAAQEIEAKHTKLIEQGEHKTILIEPYFEKIEPELARLHTRILVYLQKDVTTFLIDYVRRGFDKIKYGKLEFTIHEIKGNRCLVDEKWTHQDHLVKRSENVPVDDFLKRFGHLSLQ